MILKEGITIAEHYLLKTKLGQGSFGSVWLAHNLLADIDVAIKFYNAFDDDGLQEFRQEFKIAYKLNHPNLLNINHFDVYESCPYLVMPYCANGSLSRYVGTMTERDIWKVAGDVAAGLHFLHSQQPPVVHQDIKPDNILITSDGRYVITDFGISHKLQTRMSMQKNTLISSGTIAYMGPERFSEHPLVVIASDIWAFGMTLYELVTGAVLWEGMGGCVQLNGGRIPPLTDKVSPELSRLISDCLSLDTWNRPSAEQICQRVTAHLNHVVEHTIPQSQHTQNRVAYQPIQPQPIKSSNLTPKRKPNYKKYYVVAAALLAAVVLVSGVLVFRSQLIEDEDFYKCRTAGDFEQFIKEHPSSEYVETAQKRIEQLTKPTDNVVEQKPDEPVEKPVAQPEPPKQQKTIIIQQQITKGEAPKVDSPKPSTTTSSADDDRIFYECATVADFNYYLSNFPNGKHCKEARQAIANLSNANNIPQSDNTEAVSNVPVRNGNARPVPDKRRDRSIMIRSDRGNSHFRHR